MTRGVLHSVDVLAQIGAHPYKHPVTTLTPFTPNRKIKIEEHTISNGCSNSSSSSISSCDDGSNKFHHLPWQ